MLASKMLNSRNSEKWAKDPAWIGLLIRIYDRSLRFSLRFRWMVVLYVVVTTIGSSFFFTTLDIETFPRSAEERINLSARFDEGTEFAQIEEYANQAEEVLVKYKNEVKLQQTSIRSTQISIALQLVGEGERERTAAQLSTAIQEDLKRNIVGVNFCRPSVSSSRRWRVGHQH
jgi:multidrug efflux pump subunit AcrB